MAEPDDAVWWRKMLSLATCGRPYELLPQVPKDARSASREVLYFTNSKCKHKKHKFETSKTRWRPSQRQGTDSSSRAFRQHSIISRKPSCSMCRLLGGECNSRSSALRSHVRLRRVCFNCCRPHDQMSDVPRSGSEKHPYLPIVTY